VEINYSEKALLDLKFWNKSGNKEIQRKISELITAIENNPFEGIGKPEPLKHGLQGKWSRRINREHRIIYECSENENFIKVHSLKGHYA
jgi:toxin YoeB